MLLFQHIPKKGKGRLAVWREIEALEVSKQCLNFVKSHVQYDAWSDATFKTKCINAIYQNYNELPVFRSICSSEVVGFPLLKFKNIRKNISRRKQSKK